MCTLYIEFICIPVLMFIIHSLIIGAIATYGSLYSPRPFIMTDLNCTGEEATLLDCPYNGLSNYNCPKRHDAVVVCQGKS